MVWLSRQVYPLLMMFPTENMEKSNDSPACEYEKLFSPVLQLSDAYEKHGVNSCDYHPLLKYEELTKSGTSL
ncbi:hypothetical protein AAF712_016183, partial [Marasmius tenuissimus]